MVMLWCCSSKWLQSPFIRSFQFNDLLDCCLHVESVGSDTISGSTVKKCDFQRTQSKMDLFIQHFSLRGLKGTVMKMKHFVEARNNVESETIDSNFKNLI